MAEKSTITPQELQDARAKENVTIVDIRKKPDDRQIPGSIRYSGEALAESDAPPFTTGERVVVYCGSGNSCQIVAAQLREKGINAQAIEGGYTAWNDADLPTEPIAEQQSLPPKD